MARRRCVCLSNNNTIESNKKDTDLWKCRRCGEEFEVEQGYRPVICHNLSCQNKKQFEALSGPYTYFDGKKFVPGRLGEELKGEFNFVTMEDSEEIYVYEDGVYRPRGESVIRETARAKLTNQLAREHYVNETVNHIKETTYVPREKFDETTHLLAVENGLLDVKNGVLRDFDPDKLLTSKLPVKYDPDADCPKIKEFLKETVKPEDMPVLQEFVGYCLLKDYTFHKALMLTGGGSNGKSTSLT
ncbi:hypothetical protein AKJ43_02960 [candidate division MSBL1 archaeon SCGC-AAA261D19]|uniref:Bacteriophage/plasmid primase P4 C-terminal domain-containing protein n=1 Tax=candidate division MSBL1 archaeon SCGC-AAA261D19 TaxID=1698273 RepID=A0A133V610_9EURY|nr:hypothetical protein AKJ43_02960 [candidate division MSBL1 archaeon SCGC-AAA261D19]